MTQYLYYVFATCNPLEVDMALRTFCKYVFIIMYLSTHFPAIGLEKHQHSFSHLGCAWVPYVAVNLEDPQTS